MNKRAIELHDEALLLRPEDAEHDVNVCPVCTDWSMTEDGLPAGFDSMDEGQRGSPWGDVEYADDGFLDGVKRYPLDTEAHVRWSHAYITRSEVAKNYSSEQLEEVSSRIEQAMTALEDDSAAQVTEGDDNRTPEGVMDTITKETHEALLQKAVADETATLSEEKESLETRVSELAAELEQEKARADEAESEIARLEGELDTAQVKLKATEDENASLKEEISTRDEAMEKRELADKRADEVRALNLFTDEHISEKAERWAAYSDDEFAELVEDWKAARSTSKEDGSVETASRITGSSEGAGKSKTETTEVNARRAVLGL